MKNNLKFFLLVSLFITQQNLFAVDPLPIGSDTSTVSLACSREYIVSPYILLANVGNYVQFMATDNAFSVKINNADNYFEGVSGDLTFVIDANTATPPPQMSNLYVLKSDLSVGSEIPYTVVCLSSGKIIGSTEDDAPPKIIIVPRDDE